MASDDNDDSFDGGARVLGQPIPWGSAELYFVIKGVEATTLPTDEDVVFLSIYV